MIGKGSRVDPPSPSRTIAPLAAARCVLATVLIGLLAQGCYRFEPRDARLPPPVPGQRPDIEVGDTVRIVTVHQGTVRFKVTSIDDDAIAGKTVRVPRTEIRAIQVERLDRTKTAVIGAAMVGGLMIVALVAALVILSRSPVGIPG